MSAVIDSQAQPGLWARAKAFVNHLRPCKPVIDILEQQTQLTHEVVSQLKDLNETITGFRCAPKPDDKDKAA